MRKLKTEEIPRLSKEDFKTQAKLPVVIMLDNIRSHHNTGAFFRTADAFRFASILLTGITGTPPHRDIRKTALGASETVDWHYQKDAVEAAQKLKADGYRLYAVEITTDSIQPEKLNIKPEDKTALIFGNEVKGVQQEVIDLCDACIEIPQAGTKHSLNVSVSGGIIMWEVFKKLGI
jgi:tRNA G18 (ribose-2'-O)-methylase SpoU